MGYWHQATRTAQGTGYSLHATFGIEKRTGVDWLTWLADRSRANELFRHDLVRYSPQEQHAQARVLAEAACRLVTSASPEEFLTMREQQQPPPRQVRTHGVFGSPAAVACVTDFPPDLQLRGDTITVLSAGKQITVAAKAESALRILLCGQPVNVDAVSAAAGVDAAKLVDVLIEEGLCGSDRRVALGLYRSDHQRQLLETALNLGVTDLDTAYNYRGFTSHHRLASMAGDLLGEFTISTKVGFFPNDQGTEHCLDPVRLRRAVHESVQNLGVQPEVVLLHNPERTLARLAPEQGRDRWAAACTTLDDIAAAGWCRSWGVACWDPRPVLTVLDPVLPAPVLIMVHAGLTVRSEILDASEQ